MVNSFLSVRARLSRLFTYSGSTNVEKIGLLVPKILTRNTPSIHSALLLRDGTLVVSNAEGGLNVGDKVLPTDKKLHLWGMLPDDRVVSSKEGSRSVEVWSPDCPLSTTSYQLEFVTKVTCVITFDQTVVIGSESGHVSFWNSATNSHTCTLFGHASSVTTLYRMHDGSILSSQSMGDTHFYTWNSGTRCYFPSSNRKEPSPMLCCIEMQGQLVSSHCDFSLRADGEVKAHEEALSLVVYDQHHFISGSQQGLICVWDTRTWTPIANYAAHEEPILNVSCLADGSLVSASAHKVLQWNFLLAKYPLASAWQAYSHVQTVCSREGITAFHAVIQKGTLFRNYASVQYLTGIDVRQVLALNMYQIVCLCKSGGFKILNTRTETVSKHFLPKHVFQRAFLHNDHILLVTETGIIVWDPVIQNAVHELHLPAFTCIESFGKECIALGLPDGKIQVRNLTTGEIKRSNQAHKGSVVALFNGLDGTLISIGQDQVSKVWSFFDGKAGTATNSDFDETEQLLALPLGYVLSKGSELYFRPGDGKMRLFAGTHSIRQIYPIAKAPNLFATLSTGGELHIWDVNKKNPIQCLEGDPALHVTQIPDGRLATCGQKGVSILSFQLPKTHKWF